MQRDHLTMEHQTRLLIVLSQPELELPLNSIFSDRSSKTNLGNVTLNAVITVKNIVGPIFNCRYFILK